MTLHARKFKTVPFQNLFSKIFSLHRTITLWASPFRNFAVLKFRVRRSFIPLSKMLTHFISLHLTTAHWAGFPSVTRRPSEISPLEIFSTKTCHSLHFVVVHFSFRYFGFHPTKISLFNLKSNISDCGYFFINRRSIVYSVI